MLTVSRGGSRKFRKRGPRPPPRMKTSLFRTCSNKVRLTFQKHFENTRKKGGGGAFGPSPKFCLWLACSPQFTDSNFVLSVSFRRNSFPLSTWESFQIVRWSGNICNVHWISSKQSQLSGRHIGCTSRNYYPTRVQFATTMESIQVTRTWNAKFAKVCFILPPTSAFHETSEAWNTTSSGKILGAWRVWLQL